MPLNASDRLGPYEILSPIGAGGMGEVYKARDPRLDRTVALKVSKAEFTERFSREARTVAQLNHPHICTLYDVGPNYLVMEFIEGTPLRAPLPAQKALEYAGQILDALDAAHAKGIVHRDLKPANILVTKQGIKLLDFGLAKQAVALGQDDATRTAISVEGQISGTLQYMAPEQLEGKPADARSDIFSFGLILYELLTGSQAFSGASAASLIASILKEQPRPIRELQPLTSPGLERVLQTCLEKDPDQRWQSARELKHALFWMADQGVAPAASAPAQIPPRPARVWQAISGLLAVSMLALAAWMLRPKPQPPAEVTRFQVPLPPKVPFGQYVSWAPDGRKFVINTVANGPFWIRDLDALEWRPLPGTEGAGSPFWSPDSRYLAFAVQNQLKKIDIFGGPPQTLCTAQGPRSGSWNRDGVIIFGGNAGNPLWKIPEAGGVPTPVTAVDTAKGEIFHALPTFLPDGEHFIYFRQGGPDVAGIYAGSIDTKPSDQPRTRILPNQFAASYVNGYLFFPRDNTLMAQPFDTGKLQLMGEPVPVAEHVAFSGATGIFSVSPAGNLAWRTGSENVPLQFTWFDRQGKNLGVVGEPGTDQTISISPDATRAVLRDAPTGSPGDLWTLDFARGIRSRFTFRKSIGTWGIWSPDGKRIAFAAGKTLDTILEKPSSGAGDEQELLTEPGVQHAPTAWSRDGRYLLYHSYQGTKSANDIWVLPLDSPRKPVLLLGTDFNEIEPVLSPDMRWMAYASNESGRLEVYVRPFNASGPSLGEGKWQISREGGDSPRWTADGKQIIFEASQAKFAVDVKANGSAFEAGSPQALFRPQQALSDYAWDVTGGRQTFPSSRAARHSVHRRPHYRRPQLACFIEKEVTRR